VVSAALASGALNFISPIAVADPLTIGPFGCEPGTVGSNYSVSSTQAEIGEMVTVSVLVTDIYCQPVPRTRVMFESALGNEFVVASSSLNADGYPVTGTDGTVTATFTSLSPGVDTVRAKVPVIGGYSYVSELGTQDLPAESRVTSTQVRFTPVRDDEVIEDEWPIPGCEPGGNGSMFAGGPGSYFTVDAVVQEVGQPVAVTVSVTDTNCLSAADQAVELEAAPGGVFASATGVTGPDGKFTTTFTDTQSRVDTVKVKHVASGQYLSPLSNASLPPAEQVKSIDVTFTPGAPSVGPFDCGDGKAGTSFSFTPLEAIAVVQYDGTVSGTVTVTGSVTVTDAFCNPIQGATVAFVSTGGAFDPASGSVTTGEGGNATISLSRLVADGYDAFVTYAVSAYVNGLPIQVAGHNTVGASPETTEYVEFMWITGDFVAPSVPVIDPTNGTEVTGTAEPGMIVTIFDADGIPIPGCLAIPVAADGRFSCTPTTPLADGTKIRGYATDWWHNTSNSTAPVTTSVIALTISPSSAYRGDVIALRGANFAPGEKVSVVCNSTTTSLGSFTADTIGQVVVSWMVPADFELGQHTVTFTGEKSGSVSAPLQILEPIVAQTGGSVSVPIPMAIVAGPGLAAAVLPRRGRR
jgi:protocatechuate 3,4-dioxygenase beta subunit